MGQASVTVDIQAKIVGYQQEIEKIQAAMKNIRVDSSVGKDLSNSLKAVEREVDNLAKHMNQRLSSDSQITSFTDRLNEVEEAFIHMGQIMSQTSFGDLDLSKIDGSFKGLIADINEAKAALAEKTETGFKTAAEDSKALTDAFKRLNIDMSNLSSAEVGEKLKSSLETLTSSIDEARGRIKEINQDINTLKQQRDDLASKPILQIGDFSKEAQKILGSKEELGFNTQINQVFFKNFSEKINSAINAAKPEVQKSKDEINNILKSIGDSSTQQEVSEHLNKLLQKIRELKLLGATGLSGKTGGQLAEKMFSDIFDESKLDEALGKIRQKMTESGISEADIQKMLPNIKTNLLENNLKGAQDVIKKNLESTKQNTEKLIVDINKQLEQLGADLTATKSQKAKDEYSKRLVQAAQTDYGKIIKELQEENASLKQRVEALEKTREEKRTETLSKIHGGGKQIENKGKTGFNENIAGAKAYRTELEQVQAKEKLIGKIEGVVQRWFSIYAAVRMVGKAIRSVISTVQELDKTITEIAIVTNMTQDDLWGQMKSYTDMARQYASSISGVYKVSQLYYQQGLQTADVMALTEQTLKMARISGLDYAQATDYMTNAVRSFKMEMTDAQRVVDVYSEIAASSATSTSELASAMSKTASSAEAVGSSFENTTAMMAVMIEATRESAENIGSAMKSIISRYGEMKADPSKLVDSEGQEMSLNKVDKALQSVGITIQDTNHQFRDFDDVITELAGKWNTIDTNTQRYIATVMAGNRQQSRFLALVSNGERLAELSEKAANSEDTATLQVLKTMDSIEAKTQQLKTSLQSLYVDADIEKLYKGLLDFGATIIKTFTDFAQAMGTPIAAVAKFGLQFTSLANIVTTVFGLIKVKTQAQIAALNGQEKNAVLERITFAQQEVAQKEILMLQEQITKEKSTEYETKKDRIESQERIRIWEEELAAKQKITNTPIGAPGSKNTRKGISKNMAHAGIAASLVGSALSLGATSIGEKTSNDRKTKAWMTGAGSTLQGVGIGSLFGPWGMAIGGIIGALEAVSIATESTTKKIENFKNNLEDAHNKTLVSKNELQDLENLKKRYDELSKNRYIDADSQQEWLNINNEIANAYPALISYIDEEGNKIVNLTDNYSKLAEEKQKAYEADLLNESKEQISALSDLDYVLNNVRQNSLKGLKGDRGVFTEPTLATAIPDVFEMFYKAWHPHLEPGAKEKRSDGLFIADEKSEFDYVANQISKIDKLMAQANGNFETFKNLYQETYGQDFSTIKDFFNQGNEFQAGDFIYSGQASLAIGSYMSQIESNWDYYTSQLDNFITSQLTDLAYYFGNKQNFDYTKYSVLNDRVGKELQVRWEEEKALGATQGKSLQEIYTNFVTNLDTTIEEIQNNLFSNINISDNNKNLIAVNKIFEDFTNVSYNYLNENILQLLDFMSVDQITDLNTRVQKQIERVKNRISAIIDSVPSEDLTFEGEVEFDFLKDGLNTYFNDVAFKYQDQYLNILQSMINTGNYNLNDVPNLINDIFDLRDTLISDNNLNDEQVNELDQVLSSADLTSIFGINELKKALTKLPALKGKIDLSFLTEKIIPNLTTELDSFSQTITTKIADFEKAISSAAKGMDLKTATEMAQKLGKSLDDFDFKDGKFFFDDFTAIRDAYLGENEQYITDLTNRTNEQIAKLSDISKITIKTGGQGSSKFFAGSFEEVEKKLNNIDTKKALMEQGFNIDQLLAYYSQYLNSAEKETQTFVQYVQNKMGKDLESNIEVIENYTNDQIARAALSTGDFTSFLDQVLPSNSRENAEKRAQLQLSLKSGNIDTVLASFPEYASDILKYYQDINKNVYDKLISGLDSQQYINADEFSAETLQSLETDGLIKKISGEGSKAIYKTLDKMTSEQLDLFAQTITNSNLVKADKDKMLASIHTERYEDNIYEGLSGVVDNFDKFSYEAGQKLANALGTTVEDLITKNQITVDQAGNLSVDENFIGWYIQELGKNLDDTNRELYNNLKANFEKHNRELSDTSVLSNIIQNRSKLTEEDIKALANQFKDSYENIANLLQKNDDGTYTASITQLDSWIKAKKIEVNNSIKELIANEIDGVVSSITGLAGSQSKGYTNVADMQKYISQLSDLGITGVDLDFKNIFGDFDETLHAYRLSTNGLIAQIRGMKSQLNNLTGEQKEVAQRLIDDTARQFADSIDADSLISSLGTNQADLNRENFIKAVEDYNAVLVAMADVGEEVSALNSEALADNIAEGGIEAIAALEEIAKAQGKQITAEQAEAAWRSKINSYINAIDQLAAKPGEIVDKTTADIINKANGVALEIGSSGTYLVQTAADLYKAYKDLLDQMSESGEATLADLNKVAGLALDNKDGQQIAIDALGDAANLTYSRLGEIFTSANKLMTEELVQDWTDKGLIKALGGNKIQITDFAKFADLMGFDTGSPEYVSAFKTYNNSLIEMNRQVERNILEEAQNVASAKGGDWIDITQLWDKLNNIYQKNVDEIINNGVFTEGVSSTDKLNYALSTAFNPLDILTQKLLESGAYIENGILKIADNADILGIVQAIESTVQASGGLITSELAELADAVAKAISDYANLINTGIKGNLDNQQANQLQNFANSYGIEKLDFTTTVNGLKLSQKSATELYNVISKIDSLQGQVVFSELRSSLEASNEGLANISNTSATISRTQQKMVENQKLINDLEKVKTYSRDPERNQKNIDRLKAENRELQTQLDLYNKIATAQSSDPESFDFMNRKMPDTFNGPMNYWNSIGEAYGSMRDAASSGKMGMQDFYNIVTEMSNLAQMSGQTIDFMGYSINGDLTNASKLIQSGFNSLSNVDGKGVKVDMGKLAANLQTGAKDMGKGFDTAIQSMAKSQVAMLDGMIRLLETIVAMENLGDIDVNGDNTIDVGELFDTITLENGDKITQYSQEAQKVMTDIQTAASENPEIQAAFESFFLGGHNLWEYITNEGKIIDKLSAEGQQALATVFTKMMQLSQSGEFDLDNIQESVMNLVKQSGLSDLLNGSFYDEEANLSYIMTPNLTATVDWSQWDETKLTELSSEIDGVDAKTQEAAQALLDKYAANPADLTPGELEYVLKLTNTIQVELDENDNETGNYLFNGVSVPKDDLPRVIAQTNQIGVDMKSLEYDLDTGSITFNQTLSSSINVKVVTNKDGSKTYTMPDGSKISGDKNSTTEDAYKDWYHTHREKVGVDDRGFDLYETEEEFNAKVNAKFNNQISITGNADTDETRAQIETFLSEGRSAIQKIIDETPEGEPIQVPFADATFTFPPGTSIETITNSLMSQLGLDKNLMDSISNAITNAFTSSNNGETNVIQKAISSAIQSAFGIGQQKTGANSENSGISISGVTLVPQGLTIDLSNVGEPTLKGVEEETQDISVAEVTLKPTTVNVDVTEFDAEPVAKTIADAIQTALDGKPITPNITAGTSGDSNSSGGEASTGSADTSSITSAVEELGNAITTAAGHLNTIADSANKIAETGPTNVQNLAANIDKLNDKSTEVGNTAGAIDKLNDRSTEVGNTAAAIEKLSDKSTEVGNTAGAIDQLHDKSSEVGNTADAIDRLKSKEITITGNVKANITGNIKASISATGSATASATITKTESTSATGTVNASAAKGRNQALSAGKTLVGELGPELVVSNGKYFVVGNNGPEMVNLADDAIVFNHLQTAELLKKGKIGTRGLTVTNERKATSLATGNVGPAMASASAALAALKQLRSMWQSLLNASLKDLGGLAGGSGGGGGGGGDNAKEVKSIVKEVERWYNWLRDIEECQENINRLTKEYNLLEAKGASTKERAENLQDQAAELTKSIKTRDNLIKQQSKQLSNDVKTFNDSLASAFYSASENGKITLKNDKEYKEFIAQNGGKITGVTVKRQKAITNAEQAKNINEQNKQWNEQHKDEEQKKTDFKVGDIYTTGKKKTFKASQLTGARLLVELQRQDKYGNNLYDAEAQYRMIEAAGLGELARKAQDGTNYAADDYENIVQNFYSIVDAQKEGIESQTAALNEQKDGLLDDQIALEEINNKFKEMATPVAGVTEHLERWYNWIQAAASAQNKLNLLAAQYNSLSLDSATTTADLLKKLQEQQAPNQNNLEAITKETELREEQLNEDEKKLRSSAAVKKGIYKFDKNGRLEYDLEGDKFRRNLSKAGVKVNKNGKAKFKVTNREILTDANGNQLTEEEVARKDYKQAKTDFKNGEISEKKLNKIKTAYQENKGNTKLAFRESTESVSIDVSDPEKFIKDLTSTDENNNFIHSAEQVGEILKQAGFEDLLKEVNGEFFDTSTQEGLTAAAKAWMESVKDIPGAYNESLDAVEQLKIKQEEAKKQVIETNQQMIELSRRTSAVIDQHEVWYDISRKITKEQQKLNLLTEKYNNITKRLGDTTIEQLENLKKQGKYLQSNVRDDEAELKIKKKTRTTEGRRTAKRYGSFFVFNETTKELEDNTEQAGFTEPIEYKDGGLKVKNGKYVTDKNGSYISTGKTKTVDFSNMTWGQIIQELTSKDKNNPERSKYTPDELRQIIMGMDNPELKRDIAAFGGYKTLDGLAPDKLNELIVDFMQNAATAKDYIAGMNDEIADGEVKLEQDKVAILDINNQIRDMLKKVPVVTDHLEKWYNVSQKIADNQYKLNILTEKYNQLLKGQYTNEDTYKNVTDRIAELEVSIANGAEDIKIKNDEINKSISTITNPKKNDYVAQALGQSIVVDEKSQKMQLKTDNTNENLSGLKLTKYRQVYDDNGNEVKIYTDENNKRHKVHKGDEHYDEGVLYTETKQVGFDSIYGKGSLNRLMSMSDDELFNELSEKKSDGTAKYEASHVFDLLREKYGTDALLQHANDIFGTSFKNIEDLNKEQREEVANSFKPLFNTYIKGNNSNVDERNNSVLSNLKNETALKDAQRELFDLTKHGEVINTQMTSWYNTTRKIVEAQQHLNKLTVQYDNITKKIGANTIEKLGNLREQYSATKKELDETVNEIAQKKNQRTIDQDLAIANSGGFLTRDENGNLVKATSGFRKSSGLGKKKSIKYTEIITDENGNQVEDKNRIFEISDNPSEVLTALMAKDKSGQNSAFSDTALVSIITQLGKDIQSDIAASIGYESLEGLNTKEIADATRKWLEKQETVVVDDDKLSDELEEAGTKTEKLKGNLLDINQTILDLLKPIAGVTKGLEKWYNETKRIAAEQRNLNTLTKENSILQKDNIANGYEIYQNYKQQTASLKNQKQGNTDLIAKQTVARNNLVEKYKDLPINYDEQTGVATFSERTYDGKINIEYEAPKVDKNGKEIYGEDGTPLAETVTKTYDATGKTLPQILEEITAKNATGEMEWNAQEQYQIVRGLGLDKYIQYDENGNKLFEQFNIDNLTPEEMKAAVEQGINRIQNSADEINDTTDSIVSLTDENLEIDSQLLDIQNTLMENTINLKDQLKEAVVQEHQDAIDQKEELKDAISDAGERTVQGLRDSLDKEKRLYDSDKNEKELVEAQMKLAALQTSGASLADIRDAQKAVQEKQTDVYFDQREQEIAEIEEANKTQVELLQNEIDILQSTLDYQVKYGLIWEEVNSKLISWNEQQITDYIAQHDKDLFSSSTESQQQALTKILESAQLFKAEDVDGLVQKVKEELDESVVDLSKGSLEELNSYITKLIEAGIPLQTAIEAANEYLAQLLQGESKKTDSEEDGPIPVVDNTSEPEKPDSEPDSEPEKPDSSKSESDKEEATVAEKDQQKVDEVIGLINKIPKPASLKNQGLIKKAREKYNNLTKEQKSMISGEILNKLTYAENELSTLQTNKTIANDFIAKVKNLPNKIKLENEPEINSIREIYNSLTDDQKAMIDQKYIEKLFNSETQLQIIKDTMETAKKKQEDDKQVVKDFINKVKNLPEKIKLEDEQEINDIRKMYNNLTDEQKAMIDENYLEKLFNSETQLQTIKETMAQAEKKQEADKQAANDFIAKVKNLPKKIKLENEQEINSIREMYNNLTDDQKAMIDEKYIKKLFNSETQLQTIKETMEQARKKQEDDKQVANDFITKVKNLPKKVSLEDKQLISKLRNDYDNLTEDQKKLVDNKYVNKLINSEDKIKKLEEDQKAANKVINKINAIPDSINLKAAKKINAALQAYNDLTGAQKKLIPSDILDKLQRADLEIKGLKNKEEDKKNTSSNKPKEVKPRGNSSEVNPQKSSQEDVPGTKTQLVTTSVNTTRTKHLSQNSITTSRGNLDAILSEDKNAGGNSINTSSIIIEKPSGAINIVPVKSGNTDINGINLNPAPPVNNYANPIPPKTATEIGNAIGNTAKEVLQKKATPYASGARMGEVDYTGLAMLHGTKNRPELVLNYSQIQALKEYFFNSANTISSLGMSIPNPNTEAINGYNISHNEDSSVQINGLSLNLNVPSIANDYDARRVGQLAFDEIVKIARKSGNRSISRR